MCRTHPKILPRARLPEPPQVAAVAPRQRCRASSTYHSGYAIVVAPDHPGTGARNTPHRRFRDGL
jgi:hypothetical protein